MAPVYSQPENIETVYTYEEWLKEYNRRNTQRRIRQKTKHLYYMKQRLLGLAIVFIGLVMPFVDGDATFSLLALPYGLFLMLTNEKVITF